MHPITPFVLLTNGRESRLYDTTTKEPLASAGDSAFFLIGRQLAAAEDLLVRYEALRHRDPNMTRRYTMTRGKRSVATAMGRILTR